MKFRDSFGRIIIIMLCFGAITGLCGCSEAPPQPESPPQPVVVYDDGVYLVEVLETSAEESEDGSCRVDIRLAVENRSLENFALSSVLGAEVSSEGIECRTVPADDAEPIDGLVKVDGRREGTLSVSASAPPEKITIKLAVDYLDDQWIGFDVIVSR